MTVCRSRRRSARLERSRRMRANHPATDANESLEHFNERQIEHFQHADARCRGLRLPEGVLLRYTMSTALYFYLRTGIQDGKITTQIYASDSPYDREKAIIGEVMTAMFEPQADLN